MTRDILPPQALAALQAGNKMEAIKQLRLVTGLGLEEAKDWIESYERGGPRPAPVYDHPPGRSPNAPFTLTPKAMEALKRGDTTEAIRIICEATGIGAAEVKDLVEMIRKEIPADAMRAAKRAAPKLAPGQVAPGGGPAKWIVLAAVAAAAILAVFYV